MHCQCTSLLQGIKHLSTQYTAPAFSLNINSLSINSLRSPQE